MYKKILNSVLISLIFFNMIIHLNETPKADVQETSSSSLNEQVESNPKVASIPSVTLKVASGEMITFKTNNGLESSQAFQIPHLVLNRNAMSTSREERMLLISLNDLHIPPSGANVSLKIETQHSDPDKHSEETDRIVVWEEKTWVPGIQPEKSLTKSIEFTIEFESSMPSQDSTIKTPTDYYRYEINITDNSGIQLESFNSDYAFLLENQWVELLPEVSEDTPGAAPDKLVIYYCDMFPYQTKANDASTRLSRDKVETYIRAILAPRMVEAFRAQTDDWGFPWYTEWSNSRTHEDPNQLSVALAMYSTWYHGRAPIHGHSAISIRVDGGMTAYESLADSIMSTFHHELFHQQQRNISLHFRGMDAIAGVDNRWELFSEGTAVLATVAGQPEVELAHSWGHRAYLEKSTDFIGNEGIASSDLNESYTEFSPYNSAAYWRFLYERCGGVTQGSENPAAGMLVIRNVLETLYNRSVVDISKEIDLVQYFPALLDRALGNTPDCPFISYEDSLVHFARAIYELNLEDIYYGDLKNIDRSGFYDPNHVYPNPPVEAIQFTTAKRTFIEGTVPASFGIDFLEVSLPSTIEAETLVIHFIVPGGSEAVFKVELIPVKTDSINTQEDILYKQISDPVVTRDPWDGSLSYTFLGLEDGELNRLGIIITRVDNNERHNSVGNYRISISSE